ncbi:MAG TPA: DNA-processing protein DprA, partial [bacterium]|nr:DNA-processing protein DprA [bacterium]
ALSLTGASPLKIRQAIDQLGGPEEVLSASLEELSSLGFSAPTVDRIKNWKSLPYQETIEKSIRTGLQLLTLEDKSYPSYLRQIPDPPALLYVQGSFSASDSLCLAIVGTRHPSVYGLTMAERFAGQLAELGVTIVSGLARGIDTQAHRAALKARGRTIAVLGSGHHCLYPPENRKLAGEISQHGAVISEFPPETIPLPENFPRRNRIISGLSRGVLVVEAGQRSGALITAGLAAEQNREVFALPGQVSSPTSSGAHRLLKEGAKLVESVQDILEELNLQVQPVIAENSSIENQPAEEMEKRLLHLLAKPCSLDELSVATAASVSSISSLLVKLELQGRVRSLPGKRYQRTRKINGN